MPPARFCASLLALALVLPLPGLPSHSTTPARTLWTGPSGAAVYAAPLPSAGVLARLPGNQPLRIDDMRVGVTGVSWGHTRLWNALPAWVPLASLAAYPSAYGAGYGASPPTVRLPVPPLPMRLSARAGTREPAYLRAAPFFAATHLALLPPGTTLRLDAWTTDAGGAAWYHATDTLTGSAGWVYGDAVTFEAPPPLDRAALLAPLRGTGMWCTYALLQTSPVTAVVAAARAAGLTHLYVEVGRSPSGFYGAPGLAALLPAAHRAGLSVIAWVYPYLENLPADVAMSVAAARYVAPSGDRMDGLLADVEQNMDEGAVRAYGQVVRALLGPDELMAIATFPPQWSYGRTYPFATAALSWNAIVPMDYWHLQRRAYGAAEVYRFVQTSIRLIRARTRPSEPVEVLGQMFDLFQSGVNSPSAAEIAAAAAAARDSGALGLSFFEWNHATPEEWAELSVVRRQ